MLETSSQILWFIVAISILVFIHELGHFLAARWCGMRAEVFALGMGPRVFGWNKINGLTFGKLPATLELGDHTDFRISALPLGGYVKISGMVDESMDVDFSTHEAKPWEFRSKNALQKAFVISAGVIMNFLLAIGIFSALLVINGTEIPNTTSIGTLPESSPAFVAGLRSGDKVLSINGKAITTFDEILPRVYDDETSKDPEFKVMRDGAEQTITIPRSSIKPLSPSNPPIIQYPEGMAVIINGLQSGEPADKAGMKDNDIITAVDNVPVNTVEALKSYVSSHKSQALQISYLRDGKPGTVAVTPNSSGLLGVKIDGTYVGPVRKISYGVFEAISASVSRTGRSISMIAGTIRDLITGKAKLKESIAGPVAIAQMANSMAKQGASKFLEFLALISVMLGFMNILPIPALDGGHLVFIIIEAIIRREIPVKIRMAVQQVGVVMLLLFMVFVLYNDFTR